MINEHYATKSCNEDISLIENYEQAINDDTQMWDCHHRKETDENLTMKELKELGLYFNRPANELIFLTHSEHMSLHHTGKYVSENTRQKMSKSLKGKSAWNKDKHHSEETEIKIGVANKGKHRVYDNKELKIYHYE